MFIMKSTPEIFFSYAWGDDNELGESREKIINEIYESLLKDNYRVVRDTYDLNYKGFITDFMARIGKGKCVVVAISQKYVRSPYCMFELYEIARHSNFDKYLFREKVLPVMVEFIDFTKPKVIEEHLAYWENEFNDWNELLKKRAGNLSIEKMQRYDKIKMIYQNFDKLTEWIADMNAMNPKMLSHDNFSAIKKEIENMVSGVQDNITRETPVKNIEHGEISIKKTAVDATPANLLSHKRVAVGNYLLISVVSLIVAAGIGYYYFHNMRQGGSEKMDDRIFYLVLVLFGMAASALIFGIMNFYASINGIQPNVTYKFTGPFVGVILMVSGGFMLPKGSSDQFLTIRVFDQDKNPVTRGRVTLSFPHYQREASVNEKGMVMFPEIPYDQLRNRIIINVVSDGYASLNVDTLLDNFDPVTLVLNQSKIIRISGTVKDAADRPIRDVEVVVDGTPYAAKTINDGSFNIPIPDYHFGDRITLATSHPLYEDKIKEFEIESGKIDKIEFVLNPLSAENAKHKRR